MVLPMLVLAVLVTSSLATSPVAPPRRPPTTTPPIKPCPEALCGKNEQYVRNSNACQLTCANRLVQPKYGTCKPFTGCVCKQGLVRQNDDATGPCVTTDKCPPTCPKNEHYVKNSNVCEKSCDNRNKYNVIGPCQAYSKCVCNNGLVRLRKDGPCVKEDQCPPDSKCPPGEYYLNNTYLCEKSCGNRKIYHVMGPCSLHSQCVCDKGLIRLDGGPCAPEDQCPPSDISCGKDEEWTPDKVTCPPETCATKGLAVPCPHPPPDYKLVPGCKCRYGYLRDANNKCIRIEDCPPTTNCPTGEHYANNTVLCEKTCDNRKIFHIMGPCSPYSKCVCNPGLIRLKIDGPCAPEDQCPPSDISCGKDEEWTSNKVTCPPETCATKGLTVPCPPPPPDFVPKPGCQCRYGYLRDSNDKCIPIEDCPPPKEPVTSCPENEELSDEKIICPPQSCESIYTSYACTANQTKKAGCNCIDGYLRDSNDVCIPSEKCPPPKPVCGENEIYTDRKYSCPPQSCEAASGLINYLCANVEPEPGCICKENHWRDANDVCIPLEECPPGPVLQIICGPNEVESERKITCPPQTCDAIGRAYRCPPIDPKKSQRGCNCIKGYVRNSKGVCIPKGECPKKCRIEESCRRTCDNRDNSSCMPLPPPEKNIDGCECLPEYILENANGKCILQQDCPTGYGNCGANATYKECPSACPPTCEQPGPVAVCNKMCLEKGCECNPGFVRHEGKCIEWKDCPPGYGNCGANATYKDCPSACPRTCEQPGPGAVCNKMCLEKGCECNPGYVLQEGKCIEWKDCPRITCPANQTFVYCNVACPTDYCPVDDNRAMIACDPPYPCPPGCSCEAGYKRKNNADSTCIKASECPPVKCTRPNEVWNPTPPNCIRESCEDSVTPRPCEWNFPNYSPQCMCREGYYRNESEICVPASECTERCTIPERCRPTCANPNPKNCPPASPATTNVDGCQCQSGYVLSAEGKCVKIEECPQDQSCNGDAHARIMACPWACPATCSSPQASTCDKKCEAVGCTCESGYILSKKNGKCILPDNCPAGNPCGPNGTFVDCGFRCPNQYCPQDDSGVVYACKPGRPCPPGCACKINHLRKDYDDDRCILASECPPVDCTRPNEVWDSCPSDCLSEQCENVNDPPVVCNTLLLNCQPKCVCAENHYRNSSGICIPANDCPIPPNTCESDCTPTCAVPNPQNCPPNSDLKKPCCEDGYILSEKGGKCIPISHCPKTGCNGDPNAVIRRCPAPCVLSTCSNPESQGCPTICNPSCECAPGYILSSINGKCIKVEQCPGGDPCGPNARFVNCKSGCPTDYCPTDDSRARVICETFPFAPCYSGCVCKLNHKLNNREEKKCIVSSDCPPVNCTRPNEEWNSCPSECQSEYCDAAYEEPVVCNTLVLNCQPRCVCKKDHYRDENDICLPRSECPLEECEEKK